MSGHWKIFRTRIGEQYAEKFLAKGKSFGLVELARKTLLQCSATSASKIVITKIMSYRFIGLLEEEDAVTAVTQRHGYYAVIARSIAVGASAK